MIVSRIFPNRGVALLRPISATNAPQAPPVAQTLLPVRLAQSLGRSRSHNASPYPSVPSISNSQSQTGKTKQ